MRIMKTAKKFGGKISRNKPTILLGISLIGVIAGIVSAVRATPQAIEILEDELYDRIGNEMYDSGTRISDRIQMLPPLDVVRLTWTCYVPTIIIVIGTGTCILWADYLNRKRYAALLGVYLTEAAFNKRYQDKVVELFGKNKERQVRDEISADHIKENPPNMNEIIETGKGALICYNPLSKDYFHSDMEYIRRVIADLNDRMFLGNFVNLNDLYYELGIPLAKNGDLIGWDEHTGLLRPDYSWTTYNGLPCMVLNFEVNPKFT